MASVANNRFHEVWENPASPVPADRVALLEPRVVDGRLEGVVSTTYGTLIEGTARLASYLSSRGVGEGDAVVFLVEPGLDLYRGLMAVLRLGGRSVFVNPADGTRHLDACVARVRPKAFIGAPRAHWLRLLCPALRHIPVLLHTGSGRVPGSVSVEVALAAGDPCFVTRPVEREACCFVAFTTGSTGRPKAVQRTHGDFERTYAVLSSHPRKSSSGLNFLAFPTMPFDDLTAGRTAMLAPLARGHVLESAVGAFLDLMERHPPQLVTFPPELLQRMVEHALTQGRSFPSVETIFIGGGAASVDLMAGYRSAFPRAHMAVVYGSTEVEPICHLEVPEPDSSAFKEMVEKRHAGAGILVGRPEIVRAVVVAPEANLLTQIQPVAGVGELLVSGDHVPSEYHEDPEETALYKVKDERGVVWHRTGDLGVIDGDGRLWLYGRMRHALSHEGHPLYPMIVESMVDMVPGVRRSAFTRIRVGGLAHQDLSRPPEPEYVIAVEPARGSDMKDIEKAIHALPLPAGARGARVLAVDALPRDPRAGAKIDYDLLKEKLVQLVQKTQGAPLGRRLAVYFKERFPLGDSSVAAILFVLGILGSIGIAATDAPRACTLLILTVLGFFFHIRGFDEAKDYAVDARIYPDRPVPRGLVSLAEIGRLTTAVIALEAVLAAALGRVAFLWWLVAFLYSCLMRVEFFAPGWLRRHIFLYGISHVTVVFLLAQFICHAMAPALGIQWAIGVVALCLAWFAEIARKLKMPAPMEDRSDPDLEESYVRELGVRGTTGILAAITVAGLVAGLKVGRNTGRGWGYAACLLVPGLLLLGELLKFMREPSDRAGKKVHKTSLLWALMQYGSLALARCFR